MESAGAKTFFEGDGRGEASADLSFRKWDGEIPTTGKKFL